MFFFCLLIPAQGVCCPVPYVELAIRLDFDDCRHLHRRRGSLIREGRRCFERSALILRAEDRVYRLYQRRAEAV